MDLCLWLFSLIILLLNSCQWFEALFSTELLSSCWVSSGKSIAVKNNDNLIE